MRIRSIILTAAVAAAGLVTTMTAAPALASDNANVAGLYANNYQCYGANDLSQSAGFVNFHLAGDQLTVIIHLKGQANTTYYPFMEENGCTFVAGLPALITNSNGVGNETATVTVTPGTSYFLTLWFNPFVYNSSGVQSSQITP
jgi:hypothetical protein